MWRYFELLSLDTSLQELERLRRTAEEGALNPRDAKERLGIELVTRFHGVGAGRAAAEAFRSRFQRDELPSDLRTVELTAATPGLPIANAMKDSGLSASTSEALRMIRQGAVKIDGERIEDTRQMLLCGINVVVQVGKRKICRLIINKKLD